MLRDVSGALIGIILFSLFLEGCGDHASFGILPDSESFIADNKTFGTNKLDILFVIDNSPSMGNNQRKLGEGFNSFISDFAARGWDYKIAVAASDGYRAEFETNWANYAKFRDGHDRQVSGFFVVDPSTPNLADVFMTNVAVGTGGSGDERPFSSFRAALNSNLNAGFLRSDSFLSIIIVSDEDDFSSVTRRPGIANNHDYNHPEIEPVSNYVSYLDQLTGTSGYGRRYVVNAMAKLDLTCRDGFANIYGKRYLELVALTDGIGTDICLPDFVSSLTEMQRRISLLSTQILLKRVPVESTLGVRINGVTIAKSQSNGWWYFREGNLIRFYGDAIPRNNARIDVNFVPEAPKN